MKKAEAIERLKGGDTIVFDNGPRTFGAFFKSDRQTIRCDTVFNLIKAGQVNREWSKTACGISYITWRDK